MDQKLIRPTKREEAAINVGIAADPDTYELSIRENWGQSGFRRTAYTRELSDADFRQLRAVRGRRKSETQNKNLLPP
jgi:hypothetical protein